ncbi:MAG: ABC transporter ATP-binding protein [Bryobacteraceae bacterium]|nr:ABC transporter ATP-binding protein [Bryobacteraceae bacterium]MDW8379274.1 ABC transporter ATP-binding protein [Bryobacterales bacterium]
MKLLVVTIQHISKVYCLYRRPLDRLVEALPFFGQPRHTKFWALRDVSFEVERGEIVSVVGPNGSGKSTLLQIVSGILQPTSGRVLTQGRMAALLELGAGFNPEFSGRENVFLSGEILGLSRREMERAFPKIAAFAELGDFMDRPVKEYSSGMYVRLAFSTAIHVEPDVLIVDEALSVGDAIFASRCIKKFEELKARKVTVLFVSHDLGLVKRLSNRAVLLLNGEVAALGSASDVVNRYVGLVHERERKHELEGRAEDFGSFRHGDGTSRIEAIWILNSRGEPAAVVRRGETVTIRLRARFHARSQQPMVGLLIRNRLGMDIFGTNSRIEGVDLGKFQPGELLELDFTFECWLARNEYTVTVATQHADGASQDWVDDALSFRVADPRDIAGVVDLRATVSWRRVLD